MEFDLDSFCPEFDTCNVHHRNDGSGRKADGTSFLITYLNDLAVYTFEERSQDPEMVLRGLEILQALRSAVTDGEKEAAVRETRQLLSDATSIASLVVRVDHGSLSDVDVFGGALVEEFAPIDGESLTQLHSSVVADVKDGRIK